MVSTPKSSSTIRLCLVNHRPRQDIYPRWRMLAIQPVLGGTFECQSERLPRHTAVTLEPPHSGLMARVFPYSPAVKTPLVVYYSADKQRHPWGEMARLNVQRLAYLWKHTSLCLLNIFCCMQRIQRTTAYNVRPWLRGRMLDCKSRCPGFESLGHRSVGVSRLTLALALEVGNPTHLRPRINITQICNTRTIQSNI